jgi:hypothetical protein
MFSRGTLIATISFAPAAFCVCRAARTAYRRFFESARSSMTSSLVINPLRECRIAKSFIAEHFSFSCFSL